MNAAGLPAGLLQARIEHGYDKSKLAKIVPMEVLTPASPSDLPPLGELVADEPSWRYPPATTAGAGAAHLRVWLTTGPEPGHLAVVTETGPDTSVTNHHAGQVPEHHPGGRRRRAGPPGAAPAAGYRDRGDAQGEIPPPAHGHQIYPAPPRRSGTARSRAKGTSGPASAHQA